MSQRLPSELATCNQSPNSHPAEDRVGSSQGEVSQAESHSLWVLSLCVMGFPGDGLQSQSLLLIQRKDPHRGKWYNKKTGRCYLGDRALRVPSPMLHTAPVSVPRPTASSRRPPALVSASPPCGHLEQNTVSFPTYLWLSKL